MSQRQSHNANIMHKNTRISGLTPHSIHYQALYILVHSLNPLDLVISVPSTILLRKKKKKVRIIRLWPDKALIHVAAHTHYASQACLL
jgi:hypothetical protein